MVVKQKERVIDEVLLAQGLNECQIFTVSSGEAISYFCGGGFYDGDKRQICIRKDCVRPIWEHFSIKEVLHMEYNEPCFDILLKSGVWISGVTVKQLSNVDYDMPLIRFTDPRILMRKGDVLVVMLYLLQLTVADISKLYRIISIDADILKNPHPLTFAYQKKEGIIKVGFWDMIEDHFVGSVFDAPIQALDILG